MSNPEYLALSKVTALLNKALSVNNCVEWFADELADASIIGDGVRQGLDTLGLTKYQKASQVTNAMISSVRNQPEHFRTILDIMEQESALWVVQERLLSEYGGPQSMSIPKHTRQQNSATVQRGPRQSAKARPEVVKLGDYLHGIPGEGLEEALDREVTEEHLAMIALHIDEWRNLLSFLGMTKVDESTIFGNNPRSMEVQRKEMLLKWHSKKGRQQGTYRNLVTCFLKAGKTDLTDKVVEILGFDAPTRPEAQSTDYSVNPPHQSARCSTVSTFVGGDRSGLSTQAPPTHLPLPAIIGVSHSKNIPTLKVLINQTQGVNWHQLGVHLGVPVQVLREIEENHSKADRRRSEVIQYHLDNDPDPTLESFAAAVEKAGHRNQAKAIRGMSGGSGQTENGHAQQVTGTDLKRRHTPSTVGTCAPDSTDLGGVPCPPTEVDHTSTTSERPDMLRVCTATRLGVAVFIMVVVCLVLAWCYGVGSNHGGCTRITTLEVLQNELKEEDVYWKDLGDELHFEHDHLDEIQASIGDVEERKQSVLKEWWYLNYRKQCWETITDALNAMGKPRLAIQLAAKYGARNYV